MVMYFIRLWLIAFQEYFRFIVDLVYGKGRRILKEDKSSKNEQDMERGDIYFKEIVENFIEERGDKHDPYVFDERKYQCLRIPIVEAEVTHLETYMNGLKSLHSAQICSVTQTSDVLHFNALLGAGPLDLFTVVFAKSLKIFQIERMWTFKLSLRSCKVHMDFSFDAATGRNGCLQSLYIDDLRGLNFSIKYSGLLSWISSFTFKFFLIVFNKSARNLLESILKRHVGQFLPGYQFPVEVVNVNEPLSLKHESEADVTKEISPKRVTSGAIETLTKFTKEIDRPIWCTNLPLLREIVDEPLPCNEEYEDISIQFQFSKNNIVKDDVEPLTRLSRPTCCVFFRTESLNEMFKLLAGNLKSEVKDFKDCSFVKHSKNVVQHLLKNDNFPNTHDDPNIEHSENPKPCSLEGNDREIDQLMQRFFVNYPKFVAFVRHTEEVISEINKKVENDVEAQTLENEVVNDKVAKNISCKESNLLDSNGIKMSNILENVSQFSGNSEKLYEMKTDDANESVRSISLPQYTAMNVTNSSGLETNLSLHENVLQSITPNLKLESEKFNVLSSNVDCSYSSDIIASESPERNSIQKINILKEIERTKHIESVLKWDVEENDTEKLEEIFSFKSDLEIAKERSLQDYNSTLKPGAENFNLSNILAHKDLKTKSECVSDIVVSENLVKKVCKINNSKDINQIEHIESILKWDYDENSDDNFEEISSLKMKNTKISKKNSLKESTSNLIKEFFVQTNIKNSKNGQILESESCVDDSKPILIYLDDNQNISGEKSVNINKVDSIENYFAMTSKGKTTEKSLNDYILPPSLVEENIVSAETFGVNYNPPTAIEQLNAIGDTICMCFDNPYTNSIKKQENALFQDELSRFSKSIESQISENIALFQNTFLQLKNEEVKYTVEEESDLQNIRNSSEDTGAPYVDSPIIQDINRQLREHSYSYIINDAPILGASLEGSSSTNTASEKNLTPIQYISEKNNSKFSFAAKGLEDLFIPGDDLSSDDEVRWQYIAQSDLARSEELINDYESLLDWIPSDSEELSEAEAIPSDAEVINVSSDSTDDTIDTVESVVCTEEEEPNLVATTIDLNQLKEN